MIEGFLKLLGAQRLARAPNEDLVGLVWSCVKQKLHGPEELADNYRET